MHACVYMRTWQLYRFVCRFEWRKLCNSFYPNCKSYKFDIGPQRVNITQLIIEICHNLLFNAPSIRFLLTNSARAFFKVSVIVRWTFSNRVRAMNYFFLRIGDSRSRLPFTGPFTLFPMSSTSRMTCTLDKRSIPRSAGSSQRAILPIRADPRLAPDGPYVYLLPC